AILARMLVFSEVRPTWRNKRDKRLWTDTGLAVLENPSPRMTFGDLAARAEQDGSLDGNWFATNRYGGLKRLRPSWTSIVVDSELDPDHPEFGADARVIGYEYAPPGR